MATKFSPMRYTAVTEDAAVEGALLLVGASRDEADYEVLDRTDKGVTVRVKPREENSGSALQTDAQIDDQAENAEVELPSLAEAEGEVPARASALEAENETESDDADDDFEAEAVTEFDAESDAEVDADEDEFETESDEDEEEFEAGEDESELSESETDAESEAEEPPVVFSDEQRERALALARSFLERMGLDAGVELGEEVPGAVSLEAEGEDVGILIGKGGATLQSFQYLLNLTLNNRDGDGAELNGEEGVRVVVDAGSYRARRQNTLENTARGAAQKARTSGRPVRLDPMPAGERRIVHLFLSRESGISTQSEGREPQRRIVVFPTETQGNYDRYEARNSRRSMGGYGRGPRGGRR